MKSLQIIAGCAMLCVVGCAHKPVANPVDLAPAFASVDKADLSLSKAVKSNDRKEIVQEVRQAQQELKTAKAQILTQEGFAKQLADTRDWWQNDSLSKDKTIQKLQDKVRHFDHLLIIASSLAGLLAGWVVGSIAMRFSPYGIVIGIGAGVVASGSAWAILAHL